MKRETIPPKATALESATVRKVTDLPSDEKRSLESIVGRNLQDNQQVFIMAFTPGVSPNASARAEALAGLKQTGEKVAQHLKAQGISGLEFEAAIDEAVHDVRTQR
jgi:hypothetical protein